MERLELTKIFKMKYQLLFILLVCLSFSVQSQELIKLPMKDNIVYYEKIFQADGINKNELYLRAKNTLLRMFLGTKEVIQSDDKENGIISAKGIASFYLKSGVFNIPFEHKERFTLTITVKDNKYKIDIYDFYLIQMDARSSDRRVELDYILAQKRKKKTMNGFFDQFNNTSISLISQISNEMSKKLNTDF